MNDLALFLPTDESRRVYLAFHTGCPNRFLSDESISSFTYANQRFGVSFLRVEQTRYPNTHFVNSAFLRYPDVGGSRHGAPPFVLGRIVLIDEQMSRETHNPYDLPHGTTFYVLTVASINES